jgi:hypothetical protein
MLLQFVAVSLIFVAFITTLILAPVTNAVYSTNRTLSFQGRLQSPGGAIVADGYYNIQFKIYQDGPGNAVGNPGGSLKWTESYTNNGSNSGVEVRNGYFSVSLGSLNPFGSSVDWNQETLWLSMNVAGVDANCSTFGASGCVADGEMLPMKRITATPFALNAGAVGGKTADNFLQLAQGVQTDSSNNTSSIYLNKTGTGNLIQLQNTGQDVFTVSNTGNLTLGAAQDRTISMGTAADNTNGNTLSIRGSGGGEGTGSTGGSLVLQGGNAGGDNADGGAIAIEGGNKNGSGTDGTIYIGSSNASNIQIGNNSLASGTQTILIGDNNTAGGNTNVVVGAGGGADSGETTLQAKNSVTIATNGTTRATFSDSANTVYFGNGVSSSAPNDFTIQGTNSAASSVAGGNLTVQGGNATTGNANGGNLTLSGGTASGSGTNGLVVINTPAFTTTNNDANCYTGGALVAASCTITSANVDTAAAVIVGFSATGQVATLPDPTNKTAGRIMYISAANGSSEFTLRANAGAGAGIEQNIPMRQNTTSTLFWNGNDWTTTGGSAATTLQQAYNNTQTSAVSDPDILASDGLSVRNANTSVANNTVLQVQNSPEQKLFSVNAGAQQLSLNGGAEAAGATAAEFANDTWGVADSSTVTRYTTPGKYINSGNASVRITSSSPYSGAYNRINKPLDPSTQYTVSFSARLESGTFTDFGVLYVSNGAEIGAVCQDNITLSTTEWARISCSFQTPASGITNMNTIAFGQTTASGAHTYYVDDMSLVTGGNGVSSNASATPNVQIGNGGTGGTTLFTLDKADSAPTAASNSELLGSMYYDTKIGKVQCYESEGWGACGSSPDTFVTLSPEYSNAVVHGSGTGTMTNGICSDALNINDGSSSQPTICGTNETNNFYKWTTTNATSQSRSIFVTYQLPSNFKSFAPGSTSVMARTDSTNSTVDYQIYKNNASGLTACGSAITASTGAKTVWQKVATSGSSEPSNCNFNPGDSIVVRINMSALSNSNAYVGNLNFVYSNQ